MRFVLDVSSLLKLHLRDPGHEGFRAWYLSQAQEGTRFLCPPLLAYEVGNVLQRERPNVPHAERAEVHQDLTNGVWFVDPGHATTFRVASEHDLTFYDAAYVALALDEGVALVTADEPMRDAAEDAGVEVREF